jgi:hypothetical protein
MSTTTDSKKESYAIPTKIPIPGVNKKPTLAGNSQHLAHEESVQENLQEYFSVLNVLAIKFDILTRIPSIPGAKDPDSSPVTEVRKPMQVGLEHARKRLDGLQKKARAGKPLHEGLELPAPKA